MAIDIDVQGAIATVTMNRREALNAFNTRQLDDMRDAIRQLSNDRDIRAVILTGQGTRSFAAGADIKEMQSKSVAEAIEFSRLGHEVCSSIERSPQPWIAAINGYAFGGGCEIALACDIRYASENARIGQPEVGLGIPPGWGGTQRLPRIVGPGLAAEIILGGRQLDAAEALSFGLVTRVLPLEELLDAANQLATSIASFAPVAVHSSKRALLMAGDVDLSSGLEYEIQIFGNSFSTADQAEGMSAFIEKRKPEFNGA